MKCESISIKTYAIMSNIQYNARRVTAVPAAKSLLLLFFVSLPHLENKNFLPQPLFQVDWKRTHACVDKKLDQQKMGLGMLLHSSLACHCQLAGIHTGEESDIYAIPFFNPIMFWLYS